MVPQNLFSSQKPFELVCFSVKNNKIRIYGMFTHLELKKWPIQLPNKNLQKQILIPWNKFEESGVLSFWALHISKKYILVVGSRLTLYYLFSRVPRANYFVSLFEDRNPGTHVTSFELGSVLIPRLGPEEIL